MDTDIHFTFGEIEGGCAYGIFEEHSGAITISLADIESIHQLLWIVEHELLHKYINECGEDTTVDQDHFIFKRLFY